MLGCQINHNEDEAKTEVNKDMKQNYVLLCMCPLSLFRHFLYMFLWLFQNLAISTGSSNTTCKFFLKSNDNSKLKQNTSLWSVISVIMVVCHQSSLSSGWCVVRVVCHQSSLSSGWCVVRVVCHQSSLSSGWCVVRVVSHQSSLSGWYVIKVVCHQGGLSSEWSIVKAVCRQGGLSST